MTNVATGKIRVLVVDDSAVIRKLIAGMLESDPGIEVVGTASDAYVARERIKELNPDVITLDIEMPGMDGIQFLRNLMRLRPMPVVMCSTLTAAGAAVTLEALALGAVDFIPKPKLDLGHGVEAYARELTHKVKAAAEARVRALSDRLAARASGVPALPKARGGPRATEQLIAMGASTGGTEAIREVLARMPPDCPGIVITQHIPKAFSGPFAERLNQCTPLEVCEAGDGQLIVPGHAYVAPGDRHLRVIREGANYRCRLGDGSPVNGHKPSVDVLFRSVAETAGARAIGVLLTGMGKDGAVGMKQMRDAGAACIGQDERSSVVWGMPRAAFEAGAVEALFSLELIGPRLVQLVAAREADRKRA
jgi:two-component system chemotaxis response regulator CheB